MKRIFTLLAIVLFATSLWAQSPVKMSYQAVIRDANNRLISYQKVGMQISIVQGSVNGTAVYVETQTPTTNANGMISIEIGNGTVESGDLATIDWAKGPYFIKTETDPTGGTSYSITGISQMLSVPYALHANTAETISSTSNLATKTALGDSTAQLRSEMPDVSGIAVNKQAIIDTASQIRADLPNVNGLVTQTALGDSTALVRSEIPDVSGITVNKQAIIDTASQIRADIPNVNGLATQTALGDSTALVRSEIPNVSGIAANKQAIQDTASQIRTALKDTASNIRTTVASNTLAIQDTAAKIRADMPSVSGLATKTALGDSTALVRSEIPDVSGIAVNKQAIQDTASQIRIALKDTASNIRTTVASNTLAIQDTASQIRTALKDTASQIRITVAANTLAIKDTAAQIRADIPNVSGLATKTALGDSTALVRSEIPKSLTNLSDVNTTTSTSGNILVANGTQFNSVSISGDITLASNGAATIASNSVDGTKIALGSDTKGDIMYYDGTNWVRLPAGTSGQVLQTNGTSSAPTWVTPSSGGGSSTILTQISSNTTLTTADQVVLITGTVTVTLPASPITGQIVDLYRTANTANGTNPTINLNGKTVRQGGTDYTTNDTFDTYGGTNCFYIKLLYNGTKWFVLIDK